MQTKYEPVHEILVLIAYASRACTSAVSSDQATLLAHTKKEMGNVVLMVVPLDSCVTLDAC